MTRQQVAAVLRSRGIQPSAQRCAVCEFVLTTTAHPSADRVFEIVRGRAQGISRATVYNTLNLLVAKGLLRELVLAPGAVVFDPHVAPHHHFVDEETGAITDVPWDAIDVGRVDRLPDVEVREYQVVVRGRRQRRAGRKLVRGERATQRFRMSDDKKTQGNEGEGSRSADRRYREGVQETVRSGKVADDAERARRDVEAHPDEYRQAEREGRSRSAGEAPGDLDKKRGR
jgi:Fe2+ or Zn2+ uptake regulation protein